MIAKSIKVFSFSILFLAMAVNVFAGNYNDADALQGVKSGKILFDNNLSSSKKMVLYLNVIEQTYHDVQKQGLKPDFIIAFRGLAVTLIQKDNSTLDKEEQKVRSAINQKLQKLQKLGIKMEACNIAAGIFKVKEAQILPGIKMVGNTFVSLMGYQASGYALIPIM